MVMWSALKYFSVRDASGAHTRLHDATLDLGAVEYPRVRSLIVHRTAEPRREINCDSIERIDWRNQVLHVKSIDNAPELSGDKRNQSVLIDRDVLDALILDLPQRQSMRANDLWLVEKDGALLLKAADIGPWAVLRRLGGRFLRTTGHQSLVDWRDVEFLRGDPRAAAEGRDYHRRVTALQPSEIASLLSSVPYLHAAELLTLLPDALAADTLEVMQTDRQAQVFEELDHERKLRLLPLMAPELAVDLLARLGPDGAKVLLDALPGERRAAIIELLRYPEHTAGGIMTNDVVVVREDLTVGQARQAIRQELARPDFVYYVYVVDDPTSRQLRGVLTLRDLLLADDGQPITEVMRASVAALDPLLSDTEAARRVADQHLAALPIVSRDGRLIGAITADAALRTIAPASFADGIPRIFS